DTPGRINANVRYRLMVGED
ncbi:unnamed protein product, partial [Mycobacterium sp. PO1]